jgi:uncharacterized protein (TIGR00661 family)
MALKKRILVAPLNWGLGHATRCIPIINALIKYNFEPVLASDGCALSLLKNEFPNLEAIELPTYHITYPKNRSTFKWHLIKNAFKMVKAIKEEKKVIQSIVISYQINGIISDNRFGVIHKNIPSIYMTHQLQVLSGNTTWLSTKMHQRIINQFDQCWIPDVQNEPNLSGKLGHYQHLKILTNFIGPISRFSAIKTNIKYEVMVLLSGPEPQRTLLEEKLLNAFKSYKGRVLFVKGVVEKKQLRIEKENMVIYNFMTSTMLEKALNESQLIVSRSGYTTIMDLAKLNKRAFFIPTPGQFEQEYLAKRLTENKMVPSCHQDDFTIEKLNEIDDYSGLKSFDYEVDFNKLFSLF